MRLSFTRLVSRALVAATFVVVAPFATAPAPGAATPPSGISSTGTALSPANPAPPCPGDRDDVARCAWFELLLDLAYTADAAYEVEPAWSDIRAVWDADSDALVDLILYQFVDEGLVGVPIRPPTISWVDYEPGGRKSVAGQYDRRTGAITLNARFDWDPAYGRVPYLWTLVHELLHAQGFEDEAATEALTFEVAASLANLDEPGFRGALFERLRRAALLAADWLAADGGRMVASLDGSSVCLPYESSCRQPAPSSQWRDRLSDVRRELLDPGERRRADARLRRWDASGRHLLLDIYNARPLAIAVVAACAPDRSPVDRFPIRVGEGIETIEPVFDDLASVLDEIGLECEVLP